MQADNQLDRQTQTDRQAARQTDRQAARQTDRRTQKDRQTDRQTQKDRQTDRQTASQTDRQTDRHRHTYIQTDRQTERHHRITESQHHNSPQTPSPFILSLHKSRPSVVYDRVYYFFTGETKKSCVFAD